MKKYVVLMVNGYYIAQNKKDAMREYNNNDIAYKVIYTKSAKGNYYHNKIKVIAE